ncbi:MAG: hypothetical protein WBI06_11155 [Paludibacter sp.]
MKKLLIAIIIVSFFNFSCTEQEKIIPKEKTITWVIDTDVDDILINSKDIHSILSNITFYWYPYDYKTVEFHGDTTITFTGKLAENMLNSHVWIEVFAYAYVNGGGINLLYPNQHFMPALEKDTIVIKNPTWFAP